MLGDAELNYHEEEKLRELFKHISKNISETYRVRLDPIITNRRKMVSTNISSALEIKVSPDVYLWRKKERFFN